jgi:TetR/AcrR family transcriptional regulator, cholesterol catabolism regulator
VSVGAGIADAMIRCVRGQVVLRAEEVSGVPPRKTSRSGGESRREEILSVAADLFAKQGYATTTLSDLATAVNIAKATLFHYFPTKEIILYELYSGAMEMALERITAVRGRHQDPLDELRAMLREHALLIMQNRSLFRIFFGEEPALEPEHLQNVRAQQVQYLNLVATRVRALQQDGRISAAVHARVAAQSLLGAGSWTYQWFDDGGDIPQGDVADFVSDLVLDGILARTQGS